MSANIKEEGGIHLHLTVDHTLETGDIVTIEIDQQEGPGIIEKEGEDHTVHQVGLTVGAKIAGLVNPADLGPEPVVKVKAKVEEVEVEAVQVVELVEPTDFIIILIYYINYH